VKKITKLLKVINYQEIGSKFLFLLQKWVMMIKNLILLQERLLVFLLLSTYFFFSVNKIFDFVGSLKEKGNFFDSATIYLSYAKVFFFFFLFF